MNYELGIMRAKGVNLFALCVFFMKVKSSGFRFFRDFGIKFII